MAMRKYMAAGHGRGKIVPVRFLGWYEGWRCYESTINDLSAMVRMEKPARKRAQFAYDPGHGFRRGRLYNR